MERDCESELSKLNIEQNACIYHFGASVIHGQRSNILRLLLSGIHAYYEPEELVGKTLIAITNLPPRAMMGIDSCGMLLSAIHEEEGEEKLHLLMVDDHIPAGAKLY